jgi:hypothetical protein
MAKSNRKLLKLIYAVFIASSADNGGNKDLYTPTYCTH